MPERRALRLQLSIFKKIERRFMDRLTVLGTDGIVRYLSNGLQLEPCDLTPHDVRLILEKMCAYEDTGNESEDILTGK